MTNKVSWERTKPFSKFKSIWCRIFGHNLVPVVMNEESHKVCFRHGQIGDLYECLRCHGRTYKIFRQNNDVVCPYCNSDNDAVRETFFVMNCKGCCDRMKTMS